MTGQLFCYGFGFSAQALARRNDIRKHFDIVGTTRSREAESNLQGPGRTIFCVDGVKRDNRVVNALRSTTHLLVSASPDDNGDPMLRLYKDVLRETSTLTWVGYLSTIGVYGDQNNCWVDESTPVAPLSQRAKRRVLSEKEWLDFGDEDGLSVQVFRLAGIYGSGRSVIDKLLSGTARRIEKTGQVFNRIHVEDIANVLIAAMTGCGKHRIYNVSDDEPAPPQDVVAYGAELLGMKPPPLIAFEQAGLSAMGRSFYGEQRRMRNERIKTDLGAVLQYPTFREGLRAIVRDKGSK